MNPYCPCCKSKNVSRTYEDLIEQTTSGIDKGGIGFLCNKCECLYTVYPELEQVHIRKYPLPVEVIEQVKHQYIDFLRSKISYVSLIIFILISIGLFVYCCVTDFQYQRWDEGNWLMSAGYRNDWHYSWLFWALMFIVSAIVAKKKWSKISKQKAEIIQYENMPPVVFKNMHPRLFDKYPRQSSTTKFNSSSPNEVPVQNKVCAVYGETIPNNPETCLDCHEKTDGPSIHDHASQARMITCPVCAEQIPDNVDVCPICNERIK